MVGIDVSRAYDVSARPAFLRGHPLGLLRRVCERARGCGLAIAVHCGWHDDAASVWVAIDELGAQRLGHGWPIGTDRALLARLRDDEVVVEVCPTAAREVAGVDPARHPLAAWLDHGVAMVLGSDHPLAFATTVSRELALLEQADEARGEPGRARAAIRRGQRLLRAIPR